MKKNIDDDNIEYVYDETKQVKIGNEICTVRVRANRPSQEALRRFALKTIEIMREVERLKADGKIIKNGRVVDKDTDKDTDKEQQYKRKLADFNCWLSFCIAYRMIRRCILIWNIVVISLIFPKRLAITSTPCK